MSAPDSIRNGLPQGWEGQEGTLASVLRISGRGLHTGRKVHVRITALSGEKKERGILFRRVRNGAVAAEVRTAYRVWRRQPLCSALQAPNGMLFRTVEHLLASLLFCEIDHAVVELDSEELPILDGGALEWVEALRACGRTPLPGRKKFIRITEAFEYRFGDTSRYLVEPSPSYRVDATIQAPDFGRMGWQGVLSPAAFFSEIAPARSYGHLLKAFPAVIGGLLSGTPVLRGAFFSSVAAVFNRRVIGGMLLPDEFARHRVLDMTGDFAIAGAPLLGKVTVYQPSHRRNQKFMRTLLKKNRHCWEWANL